MTVQSEGRSRRLGLLACAALGAGLGCGGRDGSYDEPIFAGTAAVGLNRAVAIGDDSLQRVVLLTSPNPRELVSTALPVGEGRAAMLPSVDGNGLLVLSNGERPRRNADDELPSLTLIDASEAPRVKARYTLPDAFSKITLDPEGRWVVLSGAGDNFVTNPNQLVLVDLTDPDFEPITKTIRSFGAAPESFQFTEPLDVPGGERRFLLVESRQDLTLVDLDALDRPEVTIGLPLTPSGAPGRPLQVAAHPGVPDVPSDAQLAIQLANDPNLVLVNFTPSEDTASSFNLTLNLVDVGGVPSSIDYVSTDGGLRLAALVPSRNQASLVHPTSTQVESVALPAGFSELRRVTESALAEDEAGDVALLWGNQVSQVAFWSLGRTSSQAFRSVDVLNLETNVAQLFDVPGSDLGYRKLLVAPSQRFFVLDLRARQSFPMLAGNAGGNLTISVAPDGLRAWAYAAQTPRLAKVDLLSLEPTSLEIERGITQLFDIEATNHDRVLVALHAQSGSATLLDGRHPDTADSRYFPGLLLGDL